MKARASPGDRLQHREGVSFVKRYVEIAQPLGVLVVVEQMDVLAKGAALIEEMHVEERVLLDQPRDGTAQGFGVHLDFIQASGRAGEKAGDRDLDGNYSQSLTPKEPVRVSRRATCAVRGADSKLAGGMVPTIPPASGGSRR